MLKKQLDYGNLIMIEYHRQKNIVNNIFKFGTVMPTRYCTEI